MQFGKETRRLHLGFVRLQFAFARAFRKLARLLADRQKVFRVRVEDYGRKNARLRAHDHRDGGSIVLAYKRVHEVRICLRHALTRDGARFYDKIGYREALRLFVRLQSLVHGRVELFANPKTLFVLKNLWVCIFKP